MIQKVTVDQLELLSPEYFKYLQWAYDTATVSPDPSTQVGAYVTGTGGSGVGWNRRVPGTEQGGPEDDEARYNQTIHAEVSGLAGYLCYLGNRLENNSCVMACTLACCPRCASFMLYCGVKKLITHYDAIEEYKERAGGDSWKIAEAHEYLSNNGCDVVLVEGDVGASEIRMKGQAWLG